MLRKNPFTIEPHTSLDKRFSIDGPLSLEIDNDDVPTDVVAILAERVALILNSHWTDPMAWVCHFEGHEDSQRHFAHTQERFDYATQSYVKPRCPDCGEELMLERVSL